MKNLATFLMRIAQVELAVGVALLVTLLITGHFQMTNIFFIIGFAVIQSSFYTFIVGIMSACVMEAYPDKK